MLAVILWFLAMARIPVAGVTAIGFLNSIAVTPGAMLMGRADFGASCLVAKRLTERVPASVVVAMSLVSGWRPSPRWSGCRTRRCNASCWPARHCSPPAGIAMMRAFDAQVAQPATLPQLVWVCLLGALVFGDRRMSGCWSARSAISPVEVRRPRQVAPPAGVPSRGTRT